MFKPPRKSLLETTALALGIPRLAPGHDLGPAWRTAEPCSGAAVELAPGEATKAAVKKVTTFGKESHSLNVWYLYLQNWVIYWVNFSKYTIHGACGNTTSRTSQQLHSYSVRCFLELVTIARQEIGATSS